MGERPGGIETGNIRKGCMRSEVEEDLVPREHAGASVIQLNLQRFRRYETPLAHDEFRTARLVVLQVFRDLPVNHFALAPADRSHVNRQGAGYRAELRGVTIEVRDPRAGNLILSWSAGVVGTGASTPPPLNHCRPASRLRHVPRQ